MTNRRPVAGRHPYSGKTVAELSSTQLREQLVTDALRGYPTDLDWFEDAVVRIAERERIEVDDAVAQVWQEVASLGGFMPGRL